MPDFSQLVKEGPLIVPKETVIVRLDSDRCNTTVVKRLEGDSDESEEEVVAVRELEERSNLTVI